MRAMWLVVGLMGCKAPPEAPTELSELSRYLYREWSNEEPEVMAAGLRNLMPLFEDVDMTGDVLDRSWALNDLDGDDVALLETRPDRPPEDCVGVGVAYESRWSTDDHARVQVQADQRPFEPTASEHYDRFFPETDEPECFADRSCEVLETFNEATRENILMKVTFELPKTLRWVEVEPDAWSFVSRSWYEKPWEGEGGKVILYQSYSLDVWLFRGDGATWRYQTLWSETDLGFGVGEDTVIATVRNGTDQFFRGCDDAIGVEFYDEGQ